MNMLRQIGTLAILLTLPACEELRDLLGPGVSQSAAVDWHAQQQLIAAGGNGKSGPVSDAGAQLVRKKNGISYEIHARELTPGNAYSLWLVVINNPAACASTPCSAAEILTNPATLSQVTSGGTGTVAGAAGNGTMAGEARAGPLAGWLNDGSLDDPSSAEVHLVINDHGPMIPAFMPAMIKTYRAGCADTSPFPPVFPPTALADGAAGPNTCLLYQVAVFPAN